MEKDRIPKELQKKLDCLTKGQVALLARCCPVEETDFMYGLIMTGAKDEFPEETGKKAPFFVFAIKNALCNKEYDQAIDLAKLYA